jgi:hypothetical protein
MHLFRSILRSSLANCPLVASQQACTDNSLSYHTSRSCMQSHRLQVGSSGGNLIMTCHRVGCPHSCQLSC